MENSPTTRIIDNQKKRLDRIRPLLDFLATSGQLKKDNNLYIVKTQLLSNPNRTPEERLFFALQVDSARRGFTYNCFNYGEVQENKEATV